MSMVSDDSSGGSVGGSNSLTTTSDEIEGRPPALIGNNVMEDKPEEAAASSWHVHKFGGTSLASAECYLLVAEIIEKQISDAWKEEHIAVVVSAMGAHKPDPKVTDMLLSTVRYAAERNEVKVEQALDEVLQKHTKCIEELTLPMTEKHLLEELIKEDFTRMRHILTTVSLMKWQAERISELISGYGEQWSALILTAVLQYKKICTRKSKVLVGGDSNAVLTSTTANGRRHHFAFLDARRFIIINEENARDPFVCWDISRLKLDALIQEERQKFLNNVAVKTNGNESMEKQQQLLHFVVTGYVASNTQGVATTLKRDGSDYTAAILGRLLGASAITVWTDVDGVLSADPRRVPNARIISEVSYNEALGLAYFGAKVIHAKTMQPAMQSCPEIPIYIRNTFRSSLKGSRIFKTSTSHRKRDRCVCGFVSVEGVALISIEGIGLMGLDGHDKKLFRALDSSGIEVALISQPSSEYSITFAVMEDQTEAAKRAVEEIFEKDMKKKNLSMVVAEPCSIIAAVGDGMSVTSGVPGLFFSALGDAQIQVLAISQGYSGRISAVIATSQSSRALNAVHAAFRLSYTEVRVGIVGMNELGHSLLRLLETQRRKIRKAFEIDMQVHAALTCSGNSGKLVALNNCSSSEKSSPDSITKDVFDYTISGRSCVSLSGVDGNIDKVTTGASIAQGDLESIHDHILSQDCSNCVIFDCTADDSVGEMHPKWLEKGLHVVTANSKALSGPRHIRDAIDNLTMSNGGNSTKYLREVTVGGGIPVVNPLRDLLDSGDNVRFIDGIMSISMSYIMHRIAPPRGVSACGLFDQEISGGAFQESFSFSHTTSSSSPRQSFSCSESTGNSEIECSFSEAVKEAVALGLTETDFLKDLNNECAARCLLVLARELGMADAYDVDTIVRASDVLLPDMSHKSEIEKDDTIYDQIASRLDQNMKERVSRAAEKGCLPRHISSINVSSGEIDIRIVDVPQNHIFAMTPPSCETIRFFTQRHKRYPLVVQGPAEGVDSTASALLADFLHLMRGKVGLKSSKTLFRTRSHSDGS